MRYAVGECVALRDGFTLNVLISAGTLACHKSIIGEDASLIVFFVRIPVSEEDIADLGPWPEPCTRAYELPEAISVVVTSNCRARVVGIIGSMYLLEAEVPVLTYDLWRPIG